MSANKLTDTQLVLLSAAAQHPEGAIELASDLKGGAAKKTIGKLLRDGLIEEIPAIGALPVWRRDDDAGALALRITPPASPRSASRRASPNARPRSRTSPRMRATSYPNGLRGGSKLPLARKAKARSYRSWQSRADGI